MFVSCTLSFFQFCFDTITLWITLCCIFLFILFRWSPKMTLPGSGTSFMKPGSVAIKSPTNRLGHFPLLTTYSSNIQSILGCSGYFTVALFFLCGFVTLPFLLVSFWPNNISSFLQIKTTIIQFWKCYLIYKLQKL